MYAATLYHVIPEKITLFGFADDHALQGFSAISRSQEAETIQPLEKTLIYVQNWMNETKLNSYTLSADNIGKNIPTSLKCVVVTSRNQCEIPRWNLYFQEHVKN